MNAFLPMISLYVSGEVQQGDFGLIKKKKTNYTFSKTYCVSWVQVK